MKLLMTQRSSRRQAAMQPLCVMERDSVSGESKIRRVAVFDNVGSGNVTCPVKRTDQK